MDYPYVLFISHNIHSYFYWNWDIMGICSAHHHVYTHLQYSTVINDLNCQAARLDFETWESHILELGTSGLQFRCRVSSLISLPPPKNTPEILGCCAMSLVGKSIVSRRLL